MKRMFAASLAFASLASASVAAAQPPTGRHFGVYRYLYRHAMAKFGPRAVGCELMYTCHGRVTEAKVHASTVVLQRMLWPAPVRVRVVHYRTVAATSSSTSSVSSYSGGGGAAGVPACASESGTNYSTGADNTNPSSGATGRYQILPSTSAAYGCNMSTPAGQDECAGRIYRAAGASQWVGCGG